MKKIDRFSHGMGIGGWLTNYKRFNVLPKEWYFKITDGDIEHFKTYITEADIKNIKNIGMDHIRLGFDQVVIEESPFVYRKQILDIMHRFVGWCEKYDMRIVFNMNKAIGNYCDIKEDISIFESEQLQDRFIALWIKLEEEFCDKTEIVFELLNEVRDIEPMLWNNFADKTIKQIRKINASRKIIIGGTHWNSPNHLDSLKIYDDESRRILSSEMAEIIRGNVL